MTIQLHNGKLGVLDRSKFFPIAYINLERTPVSFGPGVFFYTKLRKVSIMAEKEFKTYDEMIALLISRNMEIASPSQKRKAKFILQRNGYYNVINGYKWLFLSSAIPEEFKRGTTIDEVCALYQFDRSIRDIFLRSTLHVETNIKNLIAYTFSANYGHDNFLLYKNFDTNVNNASEKISKLISTLQGQIASHSMDPNISHYLTKHGYVPMWVLNSILTFGNMSKFYSLMKQKDRQNVSKIFHIQDNTLISFLSYLSVIRNFCAHGNRLYCFKSKRPLVQTPAHNNLGIISNNGQYLSGSTDLFGAVIILRYILSSREFRCFISELNGAINKLSTKLSTISIDDVLNAMGFPHNWKNIKTGQIK